MKLKKFTAAFLTSIVTMSTVTYSSLFSVIADDYQNIEPAVTHTIRFLGYDGEILDSLLLEDGMIIDYSLIDISSSEIYSKLNYHKDSHTQVRFHAWDQMPETADNDYDIQALSETGTIQLISLPEKTSYKSLNSSIDLDGLDVNITIITETPDFDDNGDRITNKKSINIAASCTTVPSTIAEAFSNGDTAELSIYPPTSNIAIGKYTISYISGIGDVDLNNSVDSDDASLILSAYAKKSSGKDPGLSKEQIIYADVNSDNIMGRINQIKLRHALFTRRAF